MIGKYLVVYWQPEVHAWSAPECIVRMTKALMRAEEMVLVDERQEAAVFTDEIVDWADPEYRVLAVASKSTAAVVNGITMKTIYTISKKLVGARVKAGEVQP